MASNSLPRDSLPSAGSHLPAEDSNPRLARLERSLEQLRGRVEELRRTSQEGLMALRTEFGSLLHRSRFAQSLERQGKGGSPLDSKTGSPRSMLRESPRSTSMPSPSTRPQESASEPGDVVQTIARMEALEAACRDLWHSQQELTSAPEATERIVRAELHQEVGKLWERLQQQGSSVQNNAMDILRFGKAQQLLQSDLQEQVSKLASCKEDVGSILVQHEELLRWSDVAKDSLRTDEQLAAALAARVATVKNQLDDQAARLDFLHSLVEEEREKRGTETQALRRQLEETGPLPSEAPTPGLLARLERLEDTCSGMNTSIQSFTLPSNGNTAVGSLNAEFQQLRRDMDDLKEFSARLVEVEDRLGDQAGCVPQAPAPEVLTRLEKLEDTCSGMNDSIKTFATLSSSSNEVVRNEDFQREMQQLRRDIQLFKEEHSRLTEDTDRIPAEGRPDPEFHTTSEQLEEVIGKVLEQQVRAAVEADSADTPRGVHAPAGGTLAGRSVFSLLLARMEASESSLCRALFKEVAALRECVKDLRFGDRLRSRGAEPSPAETAAAADQQLPPGYRQLQAALADTSGDVASLARDLDRVRNERDATLPELTAKITAACMERIQERLAVEFAARREEFAQDAGAQHEALRKQSQALLQEARAEGSPSGGAGGTAEAPSAGDVRRLRATLMGYVGQFEAMQVSLHDLRPRVMALEAVLAARVVAATSRSPSPQRPVHASAVDTTEPKLRAVAASSEAAAGGGTAGGGGGEASAGGCMANCACDAGGLPAGGSAAVSGVLPGAAAAAFPAGSRAQSQAASPQVQFRSLAQAFSLPQPASRRRSSSLSEPVLLLSGASPRSGERPGGSLCAPSPRARVYRAASGGGGGASTEFPAVRDMAVHDMSEGVVGEEPRAQPQRAMEGLGGHQSLTSSRGPGAALSPKSTGGSAVAPAIRESVARLASQGALMASQPQLVQGAVAPPHDRTLTGSVRHMSPQLQTGQFQQQPPLTPQLQMRQLQQPPPLTPQQLQARPLSRMSDHPSYPSTQQSTFRFMRESTF